MTFSIGRVRFNIIIFQLNYVVKFVKLLAHFKSVKLSAHLIGTLKLTKWQKDI